jgi:hypothetical protein
MSGTRTARADVHHGVDTGFVERVVDGSDACLHGGYARVCVPDGDGVAAGPSHAGGSRLLGRRTGEWGTDGGH